MSIVPTSLMKAGSLDSWWVWIFASYCACSVFWSLLSDREDGAKWESDCGLRITNWLWGLSGLLLFLFWSSQPRVFSFITWTITCTLHICVNHTKYFIDILGEWIHTHAPVRAHIHTKIYTCGHLFNYLLIFVIIFFTRISSLNKNTINFSMKLFL